MKHKLILIGAIGLLAGACGDDDGDDDNGTDTPTLDSASAINTYLEGKTLVMEGDDIPTHPNGFNEDVNYDPATQCYNKVEIAIGGGNWTVTSNLGTLNGAPNFGDVGDCDRTTVAGSPLTFTSSAVLIENVQGEGECFDITVTFGGFGFSQEGRGSFTKNPGALTLELFFGGQAEGHRCSYGAVGDATVVLNTLPFTGDAQQVYQIQ